MGSHTYEWVLGHHVEPAIGARRPWPYRQPCWVFTTRTLPMIAGADIRFTCGNVGLAHAAMAEAAGHLNAWVVGGGDLAGQFYDLGLLDDVIVQFAPVTLGGGSPLLPRAITSPPLRLVSARTFGGVFAELRYEVTRDRDGRA